MDQWERLIAALLRSRSLGFLGPGPVEGHVDHARSFAGAVRRHFDPSRGGRVLDLGAGGGLPGLVLAAEWSDATFVFLDAGHRRTAVLGEAVAELDWSGRVTVICERAEVAGRDPALRGTVDLVVARSFGPPAVTAECAAPFLVVGGLLAVAEPPADRGPLPADGESTRWSSAGLAQLGLETVELVTAPIAVQVLKQVSPCPDRFPRRTGVPTRRPLF